MTGVEGYVESTASGYLAAVALAARLCGRQPPVYPPETAIGALSAYISNPAVTQFQPMNVNFSLMPPLAQRVRGKANRKLAVADRALAILSELLKKERDYLEDPD